MNAQDFVDFLHLTKPTAKSLRKAGNPEPIIKLWNTKYDCVKIHNSTVPTDPNVIIDLYNRWDISKVEIVGFRFLDKPSKHKKGILIGHIDSDEVVIDTNDLTISVYEFGKTHLLWPAAESASNFLGALTLLAKRNALIYLGAIDGDNTELSKENAQNCSLKAGGSKYLPFYKMMNGC